MKITACSHPTSLRAQRLAVRPVAAAAATLMGGLLAFGTASAQTVAAAPAASASAPASTVETITVTARKTAERLQEVPLSITAVTAKTIQDAGLRSLYDVANLTAGLTISSAGAEAYIAPTIRGLVNLNGGAEPTTAIFFDGIYLANNSAISMGLLAMERIEVVKGPVSALYGRNAFGGAINYVAKKPPKVFEGDVEVGAGNAGFKLAKASLGGPLGGIAGWQLSLGDEESKGTIRDPVNGARAGGYKKRDGMLSLQATPVAGLVIDGAAYYGDDKFDNVAFSVATNNCGTKTSATALVDANAFKEFCGTFSGAPVQIPVFPAAAGVFGNKREVQYDKLRGAYDFGFAELSGLYGYNKVKQTRLNDFTGLRDGIPYTLANAATPGTTNGNILVAPEVFGSVLNNSDNQFELRLASSRNQPVRWSAGANYFKSSFDSRTVVALNSSLLPAGQVYANVFGLPINALWATPNGAVGPNGQGIVLGGEKTTSPFAALDWDIIPALTASGEFRHTKQDKTQTIVSTTSNQAPVNVAGNGTNTGTRTFTFNNYRAGLRYKLAQDNIVYISAADGTKAGGFNGRATIAEDLSFGPEKNTTYEVGTKLTFLNNRVALGLALFTVKTKDIQIAGPAVDPTNVGLVTKNFGGTKSNGFDLDLAVVPITGLKLNAGIGYADAKFKSDAYDFGVPVADCQVIPSCAPRLVVLPSPSGNKTALSLDGLRVPRTSKWSGSLGAQYNGVLTEQWGWMTRVDYRYESARMITNANYSNIPTRKVVNLHAGVENEKYRVTLFVNNITNDQTPEGVAKNVRLNDFQGPYEGALPQRRNYGVTAGVSF